MTEKTQGTLHPAPHPRRFTPMRNVIFLLFLLSANCFLQADDFILLPSQAGLSQLRGDDTPEAVPLKSIGDRLRVAFPWHNAVLGFAFSQVTSFDRIELYLTRLHRDWPDVDAEMEKIEAYASDDNIHFRPIRDFQLSHRRYSENQVETDRITLDGKFRGKYIKLFAPREKTYYVYGLEDLNAGGVQALIRKRLIVNSFAVPLHVGDQLKTTLQTRKTDTDDRNQVAIVLKPENLLLWKKSVAELAENENLTLDLNDISCGVKQLQVIYQEEDREIFLKTPVSFLKVANTDTNPAPENVSGFQAIAKKLGDETVTFWQSQNADATLQYSIKQSGWHAVYAAFAGYSDEFRIHGKNMKMALWHADEGSPNLAGETLVCIEPFAANETITVQALKTGAQFLGLRLQALNDDEIRLVTAPAQIKPAFILHDDGHSSFFFGKHNSAESLQATIQGHARAGVYAYDWCVGATTAVNYPSKLASPFPLNETYSMEGEKLSAELVHAFLKRGEDPIDILRKSAQENKVRFSITMRAAAFYDLKTTGKVLNGQFFRDNLDKRIFWLNRTWDKLSYSYPEFREFMVKMFAEMAGYKPEALVMEFLRHPPFFGYDPPLVEEYVRRHGSCKPENYLDQNWQAIQCEIMTALLTEIRQAIDTVSPDIELEINFDAENYYSQGLDVEEWLRRGLISTISPGLYGIGLNKYFDPHPFVEMAQKSPRPCKVIPRIEMSIQGEDPSPESEAGLKTIHYQYVSENMLAALLFDFSQKGAEHLRLFNGGSPESNRKLSDRAWLARWNHFERPTLDVRRILK